MVVNRVPLCRTCGARIYWSKGFKMWVHRPGGQVNCYPYASDRAEPTEFREAGGEAD